MKPNIHPTWNPQTTVTCACGNTFTTGSTKPEIRVEICSACHPFFTGQEKLIDTEGRVDKFKKKITTAAKAKSVADKKLQAKRAGRAEKVRPQTLKEMLQQIKEERKK